MAVLADDGLAVLVQLVHAVLHSRVNGINGSNRGHPHIVLGHLEGAGSVRRDLQLLVVHLDVIDMVILCQLKPHGNGGARHDALEPVDFLGRTGNLFSIHRQQNFAVVEVVARERIIVPVGLFYGDIPVGILRPG